MTEFCQFSALLALLCNGVIALLILWRGQRAAINRTYLVWTLAMATWNLGSFALFRIPAGPPGSEAEHMALIWAYVVQVGVITVPITNLHLTLLIAQVSWPRLLRVLTALYGGLMVSLVSGYFIKGVYHIGYKWYSVPGPLFRVYTVLYLLTTTIIMVILFLKQRTLSPLHRTRLRSLILAFSILLVFGTNDLLPVMGLQHYPLLGLRVYPLGLPASVIYSLIVGYSVFLHQLLDIRARLSRLAVQMGRLIAAVLMGCVLLALLSLLVPIGLRAFLCAAAALFLTSLINVLLFPPALTPAEEALERRLLGDRFAYHQRIRTLIHAVQSRPDPQKVLPQLQDLFARHISLSSYQIILFEESSQTFNLRYTHPERLLGPIPDLHQESPLLDFFRTQHSEYLACKMAYSLPGETGLERAARQQLKTFDPEFCFPFFYEGQVFGLLLIGVKTNGDPYTPEDLRLFGELAHNLGLLLNQVRLKNQVLAAQEQELLGRMSRGLAHDLNNLLTPAQTYLQLCAQSQMSQEDKDELLPIALRNVAAIRSYIDEALFFSRSHQLDVKPCRLDETVRAAVDLMEPRAQKKDIEFRLEGLAPTVVEADEVMVKRLLGNLISNAIDASPARAPIQIQMARLPRSEANRDWVRIKVVDVGSGISRENLERVFTPYFTTKNRGDGERGFGLGLAIARRIVHLHGGNLRIASVEKKGTTVEVDLPGRRLPAGAEPKPKAVAEAA
jgi:signal transduction histidine kinase